MPSPNAASLGKYGDIPVSYYTGVPSIGIPIHTLTEGGISLPISLSYHAGGVKMGEPASWVGLGWSLSAGGMISRTVQGKPDESVNGYFNIGDKLKVFQNISHTVVINGTSISKDFECIGDYNQSSAITNQEITNGSKDGEPDIFSFSIGGYSGKFYIDAKKTVNGVLEKGAVVLIPKQDIKIDYYVDTAVGLKRLVRFTITTPNGIKYDFGSVDNSGYDADDAIETTNLNKSSNTLDAHATSWYLKRITSADGTSNIILNYSKEEYSYGSKPSGNSSGLQPTSSANYNENVVDVIGYRLNYIQTSTEKVTFIAGANRKDLDKHTVTLGSAKELDSIKIENGGYCKSFALNHSYFLDYVTGTNLQAGGYRDYRLRLNSVQELSCDKSITLPAHTFTYHGRTDTSTFLPNRYSSAIDHWGYYNGATSNPKTGFNIPRTILKPYLSDIGTTISPDFGSSNRESNEDSMKLGTLRQITYPTGGNTLFDFEANTYFDTIGTQVLVPENSMNFEMPHGNCFVEKSDSTSTITVDDIEKAFFTLNHRRATYYGVGSCTEGSDITLKLYSAINNYTSPICTAYITPSQLIKTENSAGTYREYEFYSLTKKLKDIFPCITAGIYKIKIVGKTAAAEFIFLRGQTVANVNRKVGGLRIKKITSSDGVNTAKDVIKTYNYEGAITGRSSGVLFNQPTYGYVFMGWVGMCTSFPTWPMTPNPTYTSKHFWVESSIVPLGSFEGNHLGYSRVKEYYNATGTGYYSQYSYINEPTPKIMGLPIEPLQPRIGSGELSEKYQKDNGGQDVAYEKYFPKDDACEYSTGVCIKVNSYTPGAATNSGNSSDVNTFWKQYRIRTRPYRLESVLTMQDNVTTTTTYEYSPNLLPKRSESVTNSNGTTTKTTYFYPKDKNLTDFINRNMVGFPIEVKVQTGSAIQRTKIEYALYNATQFQPKYLKECLNNADSSVAANWITKLYVSSYTTNGMPSKIFRSDSTIATAYEQYTWANKLLTKKELIGGASGTLTWQFAYKSGTSLVETTIDENGLVKKFAYDKLMRLDSIKDRMKPDGSDIQATTVYDYHFKVGTGDYNYVGTKTAFANATNTTPLITRQYLDGLVRPFMTYRQQYTQALEHQKSYMTYDVLGRPDTVFQPFSNTFMGVDAYKPANTDFSRTVYELSPLSRPIKQIAEDGKFVEMRYGNNTSFYIRKFMATNNNDGSNIIAPSGYYGDNLLYRTTILNENWNGDADNNIGRTDVFKDKLGRVVATRKFVKGSNNAYQHVDTYNVYDDFGNLVMVIPPGATDVGYANDSIRKALVFEYNYDNRNRLIKKKVPNADSVRYYYNDRDQLVLLQDGNMRSAQFGGGWSKNLGTQYNNLGQVVKTGWVATLDPITVAKNGVTIPDDANKLTETQYYSNRTWVKHQGARVLKYDTIATLRQFIWSYIERRPGYEYTGNPIWTGKQHLLSETYLNGNAIDTSDRVINDNDYGGVNWAASGYDGLQKPTLTLNYLFSSPNTTHAQEVRQYTTFQYDNGQRLKQTKHMYALYGAGAAVPTFLISDNSYNAKDQLTEKNTAFVNNKFLQSTDFIYTKRGWLSAINNLAPFANDVPLLNCNTEGAANAQGQLLNVDGSPKASGNDNNLDLFGEVINYDAINGSMPGSATPQYNGNISQIMWQVAGKEAQTYAFRYDNLDRLTESTYSDFHSYNSNLNPYWTGPYTTDNKYREKIIYDLRGNIQSLVRNGVLSDGVVNTGVCRNYGLIDNLAYTYDPYDKNKLTSVKDSADLARGFTSINNSTATAQYSYDANGNLKTDVNKGITNIVYNHLNLPTIIFFANNNRIEFIYDASGAKLRKRTFVNNVLQTLDVRNYINGIEYKGTNFVLERFPTTEGAVVLQSDGTTYQYEYTLKDHLGNARVTYSDANNDGVVGVTDIKQVNHYYPYGLNMEGNWNGSYPDVKNKYQFGEKELNIDFGLNWNDFGARFYDPSVSRWLGVDPLSEKMRRHSPYNYAFDNPMRFVDPDGQQGEDWVKGKDGKIYNDFEVTGRGEAIAKGVEYIGNNKLLLDKSTNVAYFLPFCSAKADCWGQLGETATVTESRNAPAIREDNPDYLPYKPEAVGFQVSGSIDFMTSSYSVSFGVGLGPGQAGVFMTTGAGTGPFNLKVPLSGSLSASVFFADRTDIKQKKGLENLLNYGASVSGTAGVVTGGYFQSSDRGTLKPTDGYRGINLGLSTPSGGIKTERTYTRGKIWKTN